ncbi:helix-turn-helix domain-containing protein [Moritella dasanensis]|uniref:helix-turn-helix domain-containing protein n=1 Tax=Moritella dasanensis TaxID=428031 RepID=UPI0002F17081|nr:helix-turn-helix domain-containing protein [Moritella dasanensis]
MINWIRTPKSASVAKYVESYWLLIKETDTGSHQSPKLNPHPESHLLLAPAAQHYRYDLKSGVKQGQGSHWLFPQVQTLQLDHAQAFLYLGVKFRVGALYSLTMSPVQPVIDEVMDVNLSELIAGLSHCSKDESFIEQHILAIAKDDPDLCCERLDQYLSTWLANNNEDNHSQLTRKVLPLLTTTPIAHLGEQLYCSQRTIERSFNRVTGLTLKQCQSMLKLESLLEYLYQRDSKDIDWVDLAYQFGFSDQPHLIRYLKGQIGATPNNYVKQRDLTIDVYGGVS